uniref:Uncharacterized protein n=1 Tax=Arundo donax TaxID=35708 RepID=A0A0A8ZE75_ARUDO
MYNNGICNVIALYLVLSVGSITISTANSNRNNPNARRWRAQGTSQMSSLTQMEVQEAFFR